MFYVLLLIQCLVIHKWFFKRSELAVNNTIFEIYEISSTNLY